MVLGYLLSRYPQISETFILREMTEMQRLGHQLVIAPLQAATAPICHPATAELEGAVAFEPWLSGPQLRCHLRQCRAHPRSYLGQMARLIGSHAAEANALAGAVLFWPKIGAIAARFRAAGVQHIHAHFATHPALAAWAIHAWTGIPFSFTAHAHDIFAHRAGLAPKARAASFIVAISQFNRSWLLQHVAGLAPARVVVIPCGIRPADYDQPRAPAPDGRLRLLTVASLQPYKGHEVLLRALALLRGRLDFSCRLVGDGPLRARLSRQIVQLGLTGLVQLAGAAREAEVARELSRADAFVLASVRERSGKMEGLPVALMEAMAARLPVVATELAGISELVASGRNGLLVPPGDAAALAAAVARLASAPLRTAWGEAGRQRVIRDYSLAVSARRLAAQFAAAQPRATAA